MKLRADDNRLFRPFPTKTTHDVREEEDSACKSNLPKVLNYLTDPSAPVFLRGQAAEILSLCTNYHSENREKIGSSEGVVTTLVEMVKSGTKKIHHDDQKEAFLELDTIARAAEAIWILVYNSPTNHKAFVDAGAIEALAEYLLETGTVRGDGKACLHKGQEVEGRGRTPCHHARMWSAAALQNLAADYCGGTCWFEWNEDNSALIPDPTHEHGAMEVTISAEKERQTMAKYDGLVDELVAMACSSIAHDKPSPDFPWPSAAIMGRDDGMPSLVTWAAVGALKNLALSDTLRHDLASGMGYRCICDAYGSKDWLESEKAKIALHYMGRQEECEEEHKVVDGTEL